LGLPATDEDFFSDDDGTTFEDDINRLAAAGITSGCNPPVNDDYCPAGRVSRGQMAAFLNRAFDYPTAQTDSFTDDGSSIFEADINAIAAAGVTLGCNPPDNTRYCPTRIVQRDQMASFLARAMGLAPIAPPPPTTLRLQTVADGFERPVFFTSSRGYDYVVEQPGRIWVLVDGDEPQVVLDIRDRVAYGGERGLLGLAFHPDHAGILYVNYIQNDGATVVSAFTFEGAPPTANPASERVILRVPQPSGNHNGGMIAFGPEGDLWIAMGDGGGSNDRYGNGQNDGTLLGAMLRIEVGPGVVPYSVIDDMGFAAPEIWAIGLRNPWRFSFDGDRIWIADVGQGEIEEIDSATTDDRELNFGWPIYEGSECLAGPCNPDGLTFPTFEYGHDEGCSVTGGYVYRGTAMPHLAGHYFFSDWCAGFLRSIAPDGTVHDWTDGTGKLTQVSSFGRDEAGEVYVVSSTGTVSRIVEAAG
jgi:glucose/arabinose dehydrogenase